MNSIVSRFSPLYKTAGYCMSALFCWRYKGAKCGVVEEKEVEKEKCCAKWNLEE